MSKALKSKDVPEGEKEKLRILVNQPLDYDVKLELVKELNIKFAGIKKALAIKLRQDMEDNTQTVFPLLERIYNNPGKISIEKVGCFLYFTIPDLTKNENYLIEHVPSSYLPQIFAMDHKNADWSLADAL